MLIHLELSTATEMHWAWVSGLTPKDWPLAMTALNKYVRDLGDVVLHVAKEKCEDGTLKLWFYTTEKER